MEFLLPNLGKREIRRDYQEPRHWLWLSFAGWVDCFPGEDEHINRLVDTFEEEGHP